MAESIRAAERRARELDPEVIKRRNELFNKYVAPYFNMIYKLCIQYSYSSSNVQENYNEVLVNFYRGIETYDPSRPIRTWLHIVTKRHVRELEKRRLKEEQSNDNCDVEDIEASLADSTEGEVNRMGIENYRKFYSDDILLVLDAMKPIHREALILQEAGYSLKEIADIEFRRGVLKSHNVETVKSRLFLARQFMKKYLTRDGKLKKDPRYNDGVHENRTLNR